MRKGRPGHRRLQMRALLFATSQTLALALASSAVAGPKHESSAPAPHAAPAPHVAAPAPHFGTPGAGGQAPMGHRVQASTNGGAQGGQARGAMMGHRVQASANGASEGGHARGAMGHRVQSSASAGHSQQAMGHRVQNEAGAHGGGLHSESGHGGGLHNESAHGGATEAGRAEHHAPRQLGGHSPLLHTHYPAGALAAHHEPRSFLHNDPHRDIAHDRAFVADHAHDFHTRDVRDFSARERAAWRHGLWRNEWHYGRRGWWWEVDGVWYGYSDPVFPYPLVVADLSVYDTPVLDGPDLTVEELPPPYGVIDAAPQPGDIPPLPAAPQGYFRCPDPAGYFPTLGGCASAWDLVQDPPPPGDQP